MPPPPWEPRDDWSRLENQLWMDMGENTDVLNDRYLQAVYEAAYFDQNVPHNDRIYLREQLTILLRDEYGLNFDDIFDWEAWREAYGLE